MIYFVLEDCFNLRKQCRTRLNYAAFHLSLHCLPEYKCTPLGVFSKKRVNSIVVSGGVSPFYFGNGRSKLLNSKINFNIFVYKHVP